MIQIAIIFNSKVDKLTSICYKAKRKNPTIYLFRDKL
jgi:hypothetical protein